MHDEKNKIINYKCNEYYKYEYVIFGKQMTLGIIKNNFIDVINNLLYFDNEFLNNLNIGYNSVIMSCNNKLHISIEICKSFIDSNNAYNQYYNELSLFIFYFLSFFGNRAEKKK